MLKSQTYRRFVYEKLLRPLWLPYSFSALRVAQKARAAGRTRCARSGRGNCAGSSGRSGKSQDNVIHITPNQNQTQDGLEASWLDEPERIQTDLEEIVSCTYTLPHLTLESDDASAAANAVFDELSQTVISYAQETVYPAAQEKAAIGYVNGGYSISEENGTLIVSYTLSVSYSTETGDQQFLHIYYIDLTTGELLKEE